MKHLYISFFFILLVSCTSTGGKKRTVTIVTPDSLESEYLRYRDAKVEQFKPINWSSTSDSISSLERSSLLVLEKKLKSILKTSDFSGQGKINLITLFQAMDFGLLDGLSIIKDSVNIVYTTRKIFYEFFKEVNLNSTDSLTSKELENIFQSAFIVDAALTDFTSIKLKSTNQLQAYGLVGMIYQMEGPWLPDYLFVFASKGNFIYLFEKHLNMPIQAIPKCKSVWDRTYSDNFNNLKSAWRKYCECYQNELRNDIQFKGIQEQLEQMLSSLDK